MRTVDVSRVPLMSRYTGFYAKRLQQSTEMSRHHLTHR